MFIIGVTGGVGTGKSTVARMLGRLGAHVLDADRMTHELMRPGTAVWKALCSAFGRGILTSDGEIDRRKLGVLAFGNKKILTRLSRIIHPAVRLAIQEKIHRIRKKSPNAVVVLDVPLLNEAGSAYRVDTLVVVSSSPRVVAGRLRKRSGWSVAEIRRRQAFQLPLRTKERMADFVVRNHESLAATRRQVVHIWKRIVKGER